MDADNASIPETSKNSGIDVSRPDLTPAATTEPAISVVQSDAGSRTKEGGQKLSESKKKTRTSNGKRNEILNPTEFEVGWLTGLVDGEGFVHVHYRKNRNATHPRMRIYSTTKPIIDEACRIMHVNPYVRRDGGKVVGWYAEASEWKAVQLLRLVAPHLTEPSKKCRSLTILEIFCDGGSIPGKHPSAEVFSHCPPPTRLRLPRKL